jgi:hypothetical protein
VVAGRRAPAVVVAGRGDAPGAAAVAPGAGGGREAGQCGRSAAWERRRAGGRPVREERHLLAGDLASRHLLAGELEGRHLLAGELEGHLLAGDLGSREIEETQARVGLRCSWASSQRHGRVRGEMMCGVGVWGVRWACYSALRG